MIMLCRMFLLKVSHCLSILCTAESKDDVQSVLHIGSAHNKVGPTNINNV